MKIQNKIQIERHLILLFLKLKNDTNLSDYQLAKDRTRREIRPLSRFEDPDVVSAFTFSKPLNIELESFEEAVSSKDSKLWLAVMQDEMDSLLKNGAWILVSRPENKRVIDFKWILKIKKSDSKEIKPRYKARFVTKEFSQKEGKEMDVKTAFLYGSLD